LIHAIRYWSFSISPGTGNTRIQGSSTRQTLNGATSTFTYNAANQRSGWTYDAAGNLTSDGSSYSYDALNRLTSAGSTSYTYNGDGILVQAGGTSYVQDLAAGLPQVLSDGTHTYLYGQDHLATVDSSGRTWNGTYGGLRRTCVQSAEGAVCTGLR
jgi:hypothetical protein